jgi:hypothetical protein
MNRQVGQTPWSADGPLAVLAGAETTSRSGSSPYLRQGGGR